MSFVQELLYVVSNYPGGYRLIYDIVYSSKPKAGRSRLKNTTNKTLSRLKERGLVTNRAGKWRITPEGKEFLESKKKNEIRKFDFSDLNKNREKKLIITFDIPEKKRRYRDWLRVELVALGFELVHKSVWFGPALPKEFVEYLEEIDLVQYIRFFKATAKDIV
jgi:Phenylacetic acid-responsive transcriptional repressor